MKKLEGPCRELCKNGTYQLLMFICLMIALFGPDFWVVMDWESSVLITDSYTGFGLDLTLLDVILVIIIILFNIEILAQCLGVKDYKNSFFF